MSVARNLFLSREPRRFGLIDVRRMKRDARRILRRLRRGGQRLPAAARRSASARSRWSPSPGPCRSTRGSSSWTSRPRRSSRARWRPSSRVIDRLRAQGIAHRLRQPPAGRAVPRSATGSPSCATAAWSTTGAMAEPRPAAAGLAHARAATWPRFGAKGTTAFGPATATSVDDESIPVLRAPQPEQPHALDDVSVDVRRGEVVGLGGLLGAGRSETAKAIVGALRTDRGRRRGRRQDACGATPRPRRSRPAWSMLPEDRKAEGIIPNLSVRENIVLAALPRLSRAGLVDRRQAGRDRRLLHEAAADQGVQPGAEGQRAVRRQPAEGAAGALAVPEPEGAAARRADPRHRRRGQGRGAGPDRRAGHGGSRRRAHLLRARRADRRLRPGRGAEGGPRGRRTHRYRRQRVRAHGSAGRGAVRARGPR